MESTSSGNKLSSYGSSKNLLFDMRSGGGYYFQINGSSKFSINSTGNVGIGTTSPDNKLHVYVGESGGSSTNNTTLTLENSTSNFLQFLTPSINVQGIMFGDPEHSYSGYIRYNHSDNSMRLWTNESEKLSILSNGNVGIGTTNPGSYKLAVEGTIGAREVKVTTEAWADFVFEDDYNLMPIKEVESFVKENKHLPDVPSESEVMENGISLGEMDKILLQKIEELTLYIIELKKENEEIKKQVELLINK